MSRRRSARRAVVWAFAAVATLQLGLSVALERFKPEWRDPEYGVRLRDFPAMPRPSKLAVILGSSRVQMGLNPAAFALPDGVGAYNFAQSGSGPVQELLTLKRLLAAGVRPDFLLVEVLPPALSTASPVNRVGPSERYDWRDLGYLEAYGEPTHSLRAGWLRARLTPWSESRSVLLSRAGAGFLLPSAARRDFLWKQTRPGGWMPYFFETVEEGRREEGLRKTQQEYAGCLADLRVHPAVRQAHAELLELAANHGIRVVFFVMPESPRFRSWATPATRIAVRSYLDELTVASGHPVADLSEWALPETDFADGHHLLRHAAEATSRRFSAEHVAPWATGQCRGRGSLVSDGVRDPRPHGAVGR